ncbi:response regulator [Nocardioides okcheonensis]|uniref:response regulator n=1 Tax=Nocardioides okcheonensis TaxID=2894081 RepID=UPI001E2F6256|nr:response regulator [Nocardioides okcheonensis]UFN45114.1 response regulator [Nocardioides okcheonensis]
MAKVLAADDDPDVLDLVATLLRRDGHQVTTTSDGRDAHRMLVTGKFDLCVLDHELPGMEGLEVAATVRASECKTRFVLVSGTTRLRYCHPDSVDAFVEKPFDAPGLLHVVRRLLSF